MPTQPITINIQHTYLGFTDNLTPLQKSKFQSTLDTQIKHNNVIMPKKQFILLKLQEGYVPHIEEDISYYSRKIGDYTKPKSEFRIENSEGSYYTITKTEYNFALHIINNDFLNKQKALDFIETEYNNQAKQAHDEFNRKQQEKLDKELLEQQSKEFDLWLAEQVENYSDNTKLDLAKSIFLDKQGDYNELYLCKLLVLIDNIDNPMCRDKLENWLHADNTTSKKLFYHITGVKLPSTNKGTVEIIDGLTLSDYQGIIPYKKKKQKVNKEVITDTFYRLVTKYHDYHFETVIGESITKYGLDMFIVNVNNQYQLLESKGGNLLVSKVNTKTELMNKLKSLVEQYGIDHINKLIQNSIDKFGVSPKYQDVV